MQRERKKHQSFGHIPALIKTLPSESSSNSLSVSRIMISLSVRRCLRVRFGIGIDDDRTSILPSLFLLFGEEENDGRSGKEG